VRHGDVLVEGGLRADPLWIAASFGFSGFTLGLGLGWLVRMIQRIRALRQAGLVTP